MYHQFPKDTDTISRVGHGRAWTHVDYHHHHTHPQLATVPGGGHVILYLHNRGPGGGGWSQG